jgi:serine-type D-Ala-D-Ala carboxypeptidase (penicillin-binding protein 5/6)
MRNWIIGFFCVLWSSQAALAFETPSKQALLMDANTGATLYAKEADTKMYPSSMTKIMTIYILFERLKDGSIKLEDTFPVSEKAWKMQGSKMFIHVGDQVPVADLMRGIIVQSGNDACITLAEGIAGSEASFAEMMNKKAQELGMTGSHFTNASGWPDENHYTTARDLVILTQAMLKNFPELYPYWAEREYTYNNITQPNRNELLGELGIDGLKTGHTEIAGYGIVVSGEQDGRRLIGVVNGLSSMAERINEARSLMTYGFRNFKNVTLFKSNQPVDELKVWYGVKRTVPLVVKEPVMLTLPVVGTKDIKMRIATKEPVEAPVKAGTELGAMEIAGVGLDPIRVPVYAGENVERLGPLQRIVPTLSYRLFGAK